MTTTADPREQGSDRLNGFVGRAVDDIGAALNAALVVLGDRLGYYRALAGAGPLTPTDVAESTGTDEVCAREWLSAQAAANYLDYHPATGRFSLPAEHAAALTDEQSPTYLPGLFQLAHGTAVDAARFAEVARSGRGVGWGEHNADVHRGYERTFRWDYESHLIQQWLPALYGLTGKLRHGAHIADVGCGYGAATLLMAQAFPRSWFVGSDPHPESIAVARERAREAGLGERVRFEVADAHHFSGRNYDLITTLSSLHEMGDPTGAGRHMREAIAPDGTWMIVEPRAGDRLEDNLNRLGQLFYGFSALLCTPSSLSQPVGTALGAQAGPARIRAVTESAGFRRFRQAAQTPFTMVLEVRP